jgi:hypothetical protein
MPISYQKESPYELGSNAPQSSQRKNVRPIPTGARKVDLCLTTASIIITKTSCAVRNISMKSPWDVDVPPPRVVATLRGPGKRHDTTAAAQRPPAIWARKTSRLLITGNPPTRNKARVTCLH